MNAWNPPQFLADELDRLQSAFSVADAAAARGLLVAYGKCVVHDVAVSQPASLTLDSAILGAADLTRDVEAAIAGMAASVDRWRDADSQFESESLTAGLLELRMDAWFAAEALGRLAECAARDAQERLEAVTSTLDSAAHAYSGALEDNLDMLSSVVSTRLLRNWRAMLPARHDPLPWWLDGTLEAAAIDLTEVFDRSVGVWRSKRPDVIPIARAREFERASDASLRRASAFLAADARTWMMGSIEWTLPATPLRATLYVPSQMKAGEPLHLELQDATGGDAAFDAVGSVSFLNGVPLHWRLGGTPERSVVEALWTGDLSDAKTLQLVEGGTGEEWIHDATDD